MDKKAAYLLWSGVIIISVLLISLFYHQGHSELSENKFVKTELESPDDVKGVFKNIYIAASKEKEHEPEHMEGYEDEHDIETAEEEAVDTGHEKVEETALAEGMIRMESAYEHTKPIVAFTHISHIEKYNLACGKCHHDETGAPLNDITLEDPVQKCFECHNKPGEKPKGKDAPELSESEELAYHGEALHRNCIDCHKEFNKETGKKAAPTSCSKCHAK